MPHERRERSLIEVPPVLSASRQPFALVPPDRRRFPSAHYVIRVVSKGDTPPHVIWLRERSFLAAKYEIRNLLNGAIPWTKRITMYLVRVTSRGATWRVLYNCMNDPSISAKDVPPEEMALWRPTGKVESAVQG